MKNKKIDTNCTNKKLLIAISLSNIQGYVDLWVIKFNTSYMYYLQLHSLWRNQEEFSPIWMLTKSLKVVSRYINIGWTRIKLTKLTKFTYWLSFIYHVPSDLYHIYWHLGNIWSYRFIMTGNEQFKIVHFSGIILDWIELCQRVMSKHWSVLTSSMNI